MCEHGNREAAMVTLMPGVWCDPCISPLVKALNDDGLPTVSSCCGHDHSPGRIALADGRTLLILDREWHEALSECIHNRVGCKPGHECTTCDDKGDPRG